MCYVKVCTFVLIWCLYKMYLHASLKCRFCLFISIVTAKYPSLCKWLCSKHPSRSGCEYWIDIHNGHNILTGVYLRYCANKSIAIEHPWQDYLKVCLTHAYNDSIPRQIHIKSCYVGDKDNCVVIVLDTTSSSVTYSMLLVVLCVVMCRCLDLYTYEGRPEDYA